MAGRYPKRYQAARDTAKKLRKWIDVLEGEFIPALKADDTGAARKKTYQACKFIPYYATQLVNDMHKLINRKTTEMAAEDGQEKKAEFLQQLVNMANEFDKNGLLKEADELMVFVKKAAEEGVTPGIFDELVQFLDLHLSKEQKQRLVDMFGHEGWLGEPKTMDTISEEPPIQKIEGVTIEAMQKIANELDEKGLNEEADLMDEAIMAFAGKEDSGPEHPEVAVKNYGYTDAPCLSTGFCPDHRGVRLINIDNQVYQCPIDGKVYDWAKGFTDASGNKYPGGSVSDQTAADTSWNTSIPRWFAK